VERLFLLSVEKVPFKEIIFGLFFFFFLIGLAHPIFFFPWVLLNKKSADVWRMGPHMCEIAQKYSHLHFCFQIYLNKLVTSIKEPASFIKIYDNLKMTLVN